MPALFRHAFVPFVLACQFAAWAAREAGAKALQSLGAPIDYATVVLLWTLFVLWLGEQLQPMDREWNDRLPRDWQRVARDVFYLLVVSLVSAALVTLSGRLINDGVAGRSLGVWPREWPFAVQVVMAFLLVELGSYWMHWLAHVVPFFWRFHRTHHVITAMTAMKALRTHPVDNLFFALARTVPLVMLGAGAAEVTAATSLGLGLGLLAHANLDVTPGPLGLVVNFPRYHAVHHSAAGDEGRANLGCHTVLFDRLFGTFRAQARQPLVIGVTPVGTRSLYEELLAPFVP